MLKKGLFLFAILITIPLSSFSETIDVMIKGVDDGVKSSKQQDYKEALINAKLEAIERAGVQIQAITQVVNFQTKFDMIESKAKAVLLPGFQVMDIGYQSDGTYLVILSGKIQTVSEGLESKELKYAKNLVERGQKLKAKRIVNDIIKNSNDDKVIAEAIYYQILWDFSINEQDTFDKLKAYYPDSKWLSEAEKIVIKRRKERLREIARDGNFIKYVTGVVYDKNTGLEWYAGPDRPTRWNEAKAWVENLTVAGGGWRMPTIDELKTLYQKGAGTRNLTSLLKTTGVYVWSGEARSSTSDWCFHFRRGKKHWFHRDVRPTHERGFAVRFRR